MKKEEKATAIAELTEKFGRARLAIMTECAGMPVNQITELRRQLRGAKAEYCVIKNTLAVRASRARFSPMQKPISRDRPVWSSAMTIPPFRRRFCGILFRRRSATRR